MLCVEIKYELDLNDPDQSIINYAKEHLNEHSDTRPMKIINLRTLILEHEGDISRRVDDYFLLRFLRAQSFDVEKAYQLLVNYYKFKRHHPEYYSDVLFDRMIAVANARVITTVPFTEGTGRRILIYRLGEWVPEEISVTELFQATLLSLEMGILEQKSQILGGIAIVDVGKLKFKHLKYMTPNVASQMVEIALRAYPVTVHAVHFVNENFFFKAGYKVLNAFLPKDIKQRIFFHGSNYVTLHQHISPNYLPIIYGGVHPDYSYEPWLQYADTNETVLNELKRLGYTLEDQAREKLKGKLYDTKLDSNPTSQVDNNLVMTKSAM